MKKIILSLAAMLTFGIASAQIDPAQPQQTQPDPAKGVEPDTKNKVDTKVDVPIDPATQNSQTGVIDDTQPRKDELKTRDHVKSTPDPAIVKDKTTADTKSRKATKTRKRVKNQ